jgi:copper chaperone
MIESISLTVIGMKCGGCEANVKTELNAIEGVLSVNASAKDKKVWVEFDADRTNPSAITKAIIAAGFTVEAP